MSITELKAYLQKQTAPVSISEILAAHPDLIRRTLQRWLNLLIKDNIIQALGEGRARKYQGLETTPHLDEEHADLFPSYIPVSPDSKDIIHYLSQPVSARHPVGYERDFLTSYKPNTTYYLSEPIRRQLHRMGTTSHATQPAGTYGRDIYNRLLIDLSWASSHLEGNTYSRLDTAELIEHGNFAEGKALIETQMILNHKSAIELLIDNAEIVDFNRFTLLNIHSALSENLLPNPFDEGRLRTHVVEIGGSVYKPMSSEDVISVQFDEILVKASQIKDPFEQSFFIMVHLPYLQPFADVNKRTSRLAANLPLIRANLCPLTFLDVPEEAYSKATLGVYEMNRVELLRDLYIWAYERSTKEYLAVKQELVKPDQQRLQYREIVKRLVKEVILSPDSLPQDVIEDSLSNEPNELVRENISTLVLEELRRIHEGVLARYGLRPSQLDTWKKAQA
ncbi:Fic family protein [Photobacterium sagamiensis]|uniref:Fic family protein n=1 Tax=Photobacterium sagamiensis TaxID=2910241 RepID=UPI003D13F03B